MYIEKQNKINIDNLIKEIDQTLSKTLFMSIIIEEKQQRNNTLNNICEIMFNEYNELYERLS